MRTKTAIISITDLKAENLPLLREAFNQVAGVEKVDFSVERSVAVLEFDPTLAHIDDFLRAVLKAGTGTQHPAPEDTVEVHYTGWTTDGHMFDSSVKRGRTAKFQLNRVIKGWTEGLQLMVQGEQRRFWIPGDLAYGDKPTRPGAPSGTLVFDVELISIVQAPKPLPIPPTPPDVAAAPKDAKKTASGLAYNVLT